MSPHDYQVFIFTDIHVVSYTKSCRFLYALIFYLYCRYPTMPPTILGHTMTMPSSIQCLPIDGGGGSDDEDMHKRKQCGSKLSVEDK